jgi:putative endonuclease
MKARGGKRGSAAPSRGESAAKPAGRQREACFVYVLGAFRAGRYWTYVGWTSDLDRRLKEHNSGKGARTTRGSMWILLYSERHSSRKAAMSREWYLKRDRRFRRQLAQGRPLSSASPNGAIVPI